MRALWNKHPWHTGYSELNPDGEITDVERTVFTEGQCHALALELSKATGWPFVAIDYEDDYSAAHCGVLMPDGRILDIEGAHSFKEWKALWKGEIKEIPLQEVMTRWSSRKGGNMHPPTRHAKLFVPAVLKLAGLDK